MTFYGKPKPEGFENMGTAWGNAELIQLLKEVKDKIPYEDMAKAHKRTVGGITSRLRQLAYDYYIEEKSIDEIMVITGLSKEAVVDTITRREYAENKKVEKRVEKEKNILVKESHILAQTAVKTPKSELSELQEILKTLKSLEARVAEYIKERSIFDE
jgi:predicted DNA-binding protein YlxM (UPF0122 family)